MADDNELNNIDKKNMFFDMVTIQNRRDMEKMANELGVSRVTPYRWRKEPEFVARLKDYETGDLGWVDFAMNQAEIKKCLEGDTAAIKHYRQYHKGWEEGQKVEHSVSNETLDKVVDIMKRAKESVNGTPPKPV